MLDIPTVRSRFQARKQQRPTSTGMLSGTTGLAQPTETATAEPYEYAGHGWDDPLARQAYGNVKGQESLALSSNPTNLLSPNPNLLTPLDPTKWGVNYHGEDYDKMKQEYLRLGGTGTVEQSNAAIQAATPVAAGSTHSMSPAVVNRMWR